VFQEYAMSRVSQRYLQSGELNNWG
jgi:hypothetical protein